MKMNKRPFFLGALSLGAILCACTSENSSNATASSVTEENWFKDPASTGREVYTSSNQKGDKSYSCSIYATENTFTVVSRTSQPRETTTSTGHSTYTPGYLETTSYTESSLASSPTMKSLCEQAKTMYEAMIKSGKANIDCEDNHVQIYSSANTSMDMNQIIQVQISLCKAGEQEFLAGSSTSDTVTNDVPVTNDPLPETSPNGGNSTTQENSISCQISPSDPYTMQIVTADGRSETSYMTINSNGASITDTYTGIDAETFTKICQKVQEEFNAQCEDYTIYITDPEMTPDLLPPSTIVEMMEQDCIDLLSGAITFDEYILD
ncbi:hypothetical protein [Fibrobacter sp. HC4]|uniref:hypothetical protein n=1 Tax=Fibrobacter sp. HC4 TaxID=3239812 RepID=UPI000CB691EA|nr:hypothetical protein [Fibrobacter succinogenes]MCL4101953.1 hypothetical protein [Fibrobacter succinogenes]